MKRILTILALMCMTVSVFAQGAAKTPPIVRHGSKMSKTGKKMPPRDPKTGRFMKKKKMPMRDPKTGRFMKSPGKK